jgi:ubiquinone/menaquinone biosynthesis C-methylase UbiE
VDIKANINQARQVFDQDLHMPAYAGLLADSDHLNALINLMEIQTGKRYLDLGTGNGYIAFELARLFPGSFITGLDITPNAIQINQTRQQELGLSHLDFKLFDGFQYPFDEGWFDGVVSRYAFHHFPDPVSTLNEFNRILCPGAFIILSDPITADDDNTTFIDDFQKLRPDGHIHFYKRQEIISLFQRHGFHAEESFASTISYPRDMTPNYTDFLEATPNEILQKYQVKIKYQQVYVTAQVINIRFSKKCIKFQ